MNRVAIIKELLAEESAHIEQARQIREIIQRLSVRTAKAPAGLRSVRGKAKGAAPKKRKMSAAGRKAISAAARKRWAAYRKQKKAAGK